MYDDSSCNVMSVKNVPALDLDVMLADFLC